MFSHKFSSGAWTVRTVVLLALLAGGIWYFRAALGM